jgi:hypothetical protein
MSIKGDPPLDSGLRQHEENGRMKDDNGGGRFLEKPTLKIPLEKKITTTGT